MLLAIETSCDETAVALFDTRAPRPELIGELVSSQVALHELYGGVVPELAAREHLKNLPLMLEQLLKVHDASISDLSAIAVTRGPGLKGCLLIGLCFAKALAQAKKIPLIGINHIEGHVLAPMLDNPELTFPYLALIVSGGHTEIHEVHGVGDYRLLSRTRDDAAGEAFDKSANLIGLSYPGGAKLAALADSVTASRFSLPHVMRSSRDFSFSGLKTSISLLIKKNAFELADPQVKAELAFAIQEAIVSTLVSKLAEAVASSGIRHIALSGGVAANHRLREKCAAIPHTHLWCPKSEHCVDNAAMIGFVAAYRLARGERSEINCDVMPQYFIESVSNHL